MFRYRLRTLLIVLAIGPPLLAGWWYLKLAVFDESLPLPGEILGGILAFWVVMLLPLIAGALLLMALIFKLFSVIGDALQQRPTDNDP